MASSIQYLPQAYNGYIMPSNAVTMEHYTPGQVSLHQPGSMASGIQKLVAVQPMAAATGQARPNGQGTTVLHNGTQKFVALQPMAIPSGAQRTYANGTTYLHQAAPQPRPQQLPAGTQIISAYNAEGQPVTIAVNPNGTHSVLNSTTLAMTTNGQSLQSQQVRQMPAATLVSAQGQGQRIVQLPNGEFQVQAAGAPGIYKVVQQGAPAQSGERFLVQTSQGQQVAVQRFMPSTNGLPIKQAGTMHQMDMRPTVAPAMVAQPGGIQMGRSLIHMPSRPNTTTTSYTTAAAQQTLRPNPNLLAMGKMPVSKPLMKPMQPMQQLPSTILVKPGGHNDNGLSQVLPQQAGGVPGMQPQSLQQQVKDTAAQQRQQQLLASLRARVASLHHVQNGQSVSTSPGLPQQGQTVVGPDGQVRRLVAVGEHAAAPASTAMHLQPDNGARMMLGQRQQQHGSMDSQSMLALAPNQQQALMQHQGLLAMQRTDSNQTMNSGQNVDHQTLLARQQADNNQARIVSETLDRQALAQHQQRQFAMHEAMGGASNHGGGEEPHQGFMQASRMVFLSNGLASRGSHSSDGKLHQASLGQPSSPDGSLGKEDLRAILLSIGVELARHGIDVETAVDAGWLGVLSPTDVAVLQEAYRIEARRLAMDASNYNGNERRTDTQSSFGLEERRNEVAAFNACSSISRGSPALSVMSASVVDNIWAPTPPAVDPPVQLTDIDDARFSAFAYDFFGSHDNGDVGAANFLEALEPDAAGNVNLANGLASRGGSGHSSIATAPAGDATAPVVRPGPTRAPSWPPASNSAPPGPLQVDGQSMASFSDMCAATVPTNVEAGSDRESNSSSNQELVARIANLDLGCGFY